MHQIDWAKLDDERFVKLTGELLARLGFIDISFQGDGPDGGVDIFATELVPFTFQGRIPFRWAIQCKYSAAGQRGSVNDREVRDVEGLLRSDRCQGQDPRGYLLITNRKIVQNVVERLTGIDRRSQFRTARVDGAELEKLLANHAEITDFYFAEKDASLGELLLVIPPKPYPRNPRYPDVNVEIRAPGGKSGIRIPARIDMLSGLSLIPFGMAETLGAPVIGRTVVLVEHRVQESPIFLLDIAIGPILLHDVQAAAIPPHLGPAILGSSIATNHSVLIEPSGRVSFYDKSSRPEEG